MKWQNNHLSVFHNITDCHCRKIVMITKWTMTHFITPKLVWCVHESDIPSKWRHNGRDGVLNHQPYDCLLSHLFGRRSKKTSKLRVTGLCAGNSPGTGEFPAQMASNAENVSIWWRHHVKSPVHQKAWYWLFRTYNMQCCSGVNFVYLDGTKSKIRFKMWTHLL